MLPGRPARTLVALVVWLVSALGVSAAGAARRERRVELSDPSRSYSLGRGMWLLADPGDEIDFEEARAAFRAGRFSEVESERPPLSFRWKAAWVTTSSMAARATTA